LASSHPEVPPSLLRQSESFFDVTLEQATNMAKLETTVSDSNLPNFMHSLFDQIQMEKA
jgi:hypothetical protein